MNYSMRSGLSQSGLVAMPPTTFRDSSRRCRRSPALGGRLVFAILIGWGLAAATAQGADAPASGCVLLEKEGKVQVARKGTTAFKAVEVKTTLQDGDQV